MPRDLFGHVTRPSISIGSRKWYTLPVSLFSHSAAVALPKQGWSTSSNTLL